MRNVISALWSRKMGSWCERLVGHGRLMGEHAYRQLDELYRALHWYVNCFQPSMKLVSKQVEGRTIHRIYDAAKTPLQRVLLSGALSPAQQQELCTIGKAFDPLRLFQQVEQLQQATLRCEAGRSSAGQATPPISLVPFDLAACAAELVLQEGSETDEFPHEEQKRASALNWRRTSKDPFAGQWKQILTWVQANPTRSSGDILRELQSLYPGRHGHSRLRTLQRGMRKIRTHLLQTNERTASPEGPQANLSLPDELKLSTPAPGDLAPSSFPASVGTPSPGDTSARLCDRHQSAEEPPSPTGRETRRSVPAALTSSRPEPGQLARRPPAVSSPPAAHSSSPEQSQHLTIERAVQEYLQAHAKSGIA